MRHLHWILPLALVTGLVACDSDDTPRGPTDLRGCGDDAPDDPPDAGPGADGPVPDSGPDGCVVTGDGSLFSQCCVFGAPDPCASGTACYWDSDPHAGPESGVCFPIGETAIGDTCDITTNACIPGATCVTDENTPEAGTGTCRQLCDPQEPACGEGEHCGPSSSDAMGLCLPGAV